METVKIIEHEGKFYLEAMGDGRALTDLEAGPYTTREQAEKAALELPKDH